MADSPAVAQSSNREYLGLFLDSASKVELLTRDQEITLARRVAKGGVPRAFVAAKQARSRIAAAGGDLAAQNAAAAGAAARAAGELAQSREMRFVQTNALLAAARLSLTAHDVHALDLVVAAWRLSPRSFGFTVDGVEYPHTNRVLSKLSGADSLTSLGWLLLDGTSTYRVTERGRSAVLDLAARRA